MSETDKIRWIVERFTDNKYGIDVGSGPHPLPGAYGIDIQKYPGVIQGDIRGGLLEVLKGSVIETNAVMGVGNKFKLDYIYSSHLLEDFAPEKQVEVVQDWRKCLCLGGLMIIYVPQKGAYKGCNLAHKGEFILGQMEGILIAANLSRVLIYYESVVYKDMYGILGIGLKTDE